MSEERRAKGYRGGSAGPVTRMSEAGPAEPTSEVLERRRELRFGRMFDQMRDAVILADATGEILLWNPAASTIFGYTPEEALTMNVRALVPPELVGAHERGMSRYAETGHGRYIDSSQVLELPAVRKDGRRIFVEMTLSPVSGDPPRSIATIRDVTEKVRMREKADLDRRRLAAANEILETFSYVVAHDLKEPVRGILAELEEVKADYGTPAGLESLQRASRTADRLAGLLQGLLQWSRAANVELELQPVDVRRVIASEPCVVAYERLRDERGARVEVSGDIPPVLASETILCQIFSNLIVNAIRHNPAERPAVRVRAEQVDMDWVHVVVEDNGVGFPPHVVERLAAMRSHRPRTLQGGFGLSIASMATARLGGELKLGSGPGGAGGAVTLRLPRAR